MRYHSCPEFSPHPSSHPHQDPGPTGESSHCGKAPRALPPSLDNPHPPPAFSPRSPCSPAFRLQEQTAIVHIDVRDPPARPRLRPRPPARRCSSAAGLDIEIDPPGSTKRRSAPASPQKARPRTTRPMPWPSSRRSKIADEKAGSDLVLGADQILALKTRIFVQARKPRSRPRPTLSTCAARPISCTPPSSSTTRASRSGAMSAPPA